VVQSKAKTVAEYLAELPDDRRKSIEAVRSVILENLDRDFEEGIQYGMIGYYVPHRLYPAGYHCDPRQPLPFAALGSQKNYMSLYLMCIYGDPNELKWFQQTWKSAGKKLDMGKACVRFKSLDDVPLDVVAEVIRRVRAANYIEQCERAVKAARSGKSADPKRASKRVVPARQSKKQTKSAARASARSRKH
jgi:Domain of unknown function (DU1801)